MCKCSWPLIVGIIGLVIFLLGIILGWAVFPPLVKNQVADNTAIVEGTDQFDRFKSLPQPLIFKVYFFEIQNPDAVHTGARPNVTEKGPYVYKQYRDKTNIKFSPDKTSVFFNTNRRYVFDAELSSPLTDLDEIHVVSPHLLSILQTAEMTSSSLELMVINAVIWRVFNDPTTLFIKTTPREILFDGIKFCIDRRGTAADVCNTIKEAGSPNVELNEDGTLSFSLFKSKNTTFDGDFEVFTGTSDPLLTHIIKTYNNNVTIDVWPNNDDGTTSVCNEVRGTDGIFQPPFREPDTVLPSFLTDICRSVNIYYDRKDTYEGIQGLRFSLRNDFLNEIGPEHNNHCFCINKTRGITKENGCLHKGALDMFNCLQGPLVLTKPHMLDVAEEYTSLIDGQKPDANIHSTFLLVDPFTGIPLQGSKKVQFNLVLRPVNRIRITNNYTTTLMPLVWIEEGSELNVEMLNILNSSLYDILKILDIVKYVLIAAGGALIVISLIGFLCKRNRRKNNISMNN